MDNKAQDTKPASTKYKNVQFVLLCELATLGIDPGKVLNSRIMYKDMTPFWHSGRIGLILKVDSASFTLTPCTSTCSISMLLELASADGVKFKATWKALTVGSLDDHKHSNPLIIEPQVMIFNCAESDQERLIFPNMSWDNLSKQEQQCLAKITGYVALTLDVLEKIHEKNLTVARESL